MAAVTKTGRVRPHGPRAKGLWLVTSILGGDRYGSLDEIGATVIRGTKREADAFASRIRAQLGDSADVTSVQIKNAATANAELDVEIAENEAAGRIG